jgi:antirestriction protein ArdC
VVTTTEATTDRRRELLTQLGHQTEALASSDGWQRWLKFAASFRTYSLGNQLLIQAQRPEATYVAGFATWRTLGRTVKKGEHGIAILAPMVRKVASDEADGEPRRSLSGFRVVFVFDISQTEGEAVPRMHMPPVTVPNARLLAQLIAITDDAGISVRLVDKAAEPGVRGWFNYLERTISLVTSGVTVDSQVRTLLHELAHAHDEFIALTPINREERELVAESAAYLVGVGLGLDMADASTFYLTSWGANQERMGRVAEQVLDVARRIDDFLAGLHVDG